MPAARPDPPLVVLWRITEYCDLGCHFCAYSHTLRRPRTPANPEDVLRFGALLGDYARAAGRVILVSWLGGEPLGWKPLFEISNRFKHDFGLRLSLTTNGTRLGEARLREQLAADFDEVTVSVDGVGPDHDRWRQAAGLYARLAENVRRLKALKLTRGYGPRLRANTILMHDTVYQFEALCRDLAAWGVESLTFNALGGNDRPEFFPAHRLQVEDVNWFRETLPQIRERVAQLGLTILGSEHYLQRLASSAAAQPTPVYDCQPGQHFLFIDEHGRVAPCSFTARGYGRPLNEIHTPDDLRRLPGQMAEHKQRDMLPPCFDCLSTQVFGKFQTYD